VVKYPKMVQSEIHARTTDARILRTPNKTPLTAFANAPNTKTVPPQACIGALSQKWVLRKVNAGPFISASALAWLRIERVNLTVCR
jgi:hypothetical protein